MQIYAKMDQLQIPRALSSTEETELISQCMEYDKIIVGFHRTNNDPKKNFGVTIQSIEIFQKISANSDVTGVLFGNAYALEKFGDLKTTKAFVVAYQDKRLYQRTGSTTYFWRYSSKRKITRFWF
jgi:beta-N-acetylhexosaminidase